MRDYYFSTPLSDWVKPMSEKVIGVVYPRRKHVDLFVSLLSGEYRLSLEEGKAVLRKIEGDEVSGNVCPKCGHSFENHAKSHCLVCDCNYGTWNEIDHLRAELEKAERRIEQLMEAGRQQEVEIGGLVRAGTTVMKECDEARKLAQKYYALWRMAESEILRILKIGRLKERA